MADAGQLYTYLPSASDADGDAITFSIVNQPQWTTFNSVNGELRGTPSDADVGDTAEIQITATDGKDNSPSTTFKIKVRPRNQPPPPPQNAAPTVSGSPAGSVVAGQAYAFQPTAADADGDALSFTILNKPVWASFSTATGRLAGTPGTARVGSYPNITIAVSDGRASATLPAFTIQVQAPANRAPTISGTPATTIASGSAYAFQPTASDPDGNNLTFSVQGIPVWATFSTSTGRLSGTPASAHVGAHTGIIITVSDGNASASLPSFAITVSNAAPTVSGTPTTSVNVGVAYSFQPSAADPNGDPLTFSIQNGPGWATFDAATGRLSGTPAAANAGSYANIVISVSDGRASAALSPFTLQVVAQQANRAPTITGTPATTIASGSAYAFQAAASDPDGNALTFSVQNRPAWATFNTSTGRLSGTPVSAHVGAHSGIVISVSDGIATASLPAFAITVTNAAPTISGTPSASVNVAAAYSFQPGAADANGDALTFSIQNMPPWATFNTANGRLSGTPAAANVGTYASIVISVSDGRASTSLAPFSIAVNQVSLGSATLTWLPPTQNEDGTPIVGLAGYRIQYGTSPGALTQMIQAANPGLTSYVVGDLAPGTYYFAVKAYTSAGLESALSNVASKTIQ